MSKGSLGVNDRIQNLIEALDNARGALSARGESDIVDATSVEALERAHRRAIRAANRIGEQLARDRLALETADFKIEELSLRSIIADLRTDVEAEAESRGVALQIDPGPDVQMMGSRVLLTRSVTRLLRAAIRALENGDQIELEASAEDAGPVIRIRGSNADLSSQIVPHLIDSGVSQAERRPRAPLDMELLALRPTVEAQGGRVWVEGEGQAGSALCLSLPTTFEPPPSTETKAAVTVLIVDDDTDGAFLLEQALHKGGYETLVAHDGLSGLKIAKSSEVSLVLLDVMLPGMDGFEVCRRLRAEPATSELPVIMISAKSRPEDRETGLKMGADAYMFKPIGLAELLDMVTEHIGGSEATG